MKTHYRIVLLTLLCSSLSSSRAQFGPRALNGPHLGGSNARLFGEHSSFSANLEMQTKSGTDDSTLVPGKLAVDTGNTRFEIDMTRVANKKIPADAAVQMKSMGLDKMVMISRSDKKVSYLVYPGMQAYIENPLSAADTTRPDSEYKFETTELGRETVDGHPCIKNKAVVTDPDGTKHESTIWNATDLRKFPVKIEQIKDGSVTTMVFKDVSLAKPSADNFDLPSGYTRYDSMQGMMQQLIMKQLGGGLGRGAKEQ